jgi:hypothetical protein
MSFKSPELIAPEIWRSVAVFLDKSSLNNFCQTSNYFLNVARPVLYRSLRLPFDPHPSETLKLLCSNDKLARNVYTVIVLTTSPGKLLDSQTSIEHPTFLETILKLNSLKELKLQTSIFASESDVQLFVQKVQDRRIPLRALSYSAIGPWRRIPCLNMPLVGLTHLDWSVFFTSNDCETMC